MSKKKIIDLTKVVRIDQEDYEFFDAMRNEMRLSSVAAAVNYVLKVYKEKKEG